MDDLVIVSCDKNKLTELLENIKAFCEVKLDLVVHPNKIVLQPATQGIEFLGFKINNHKSIVKPSNMARIKKRLKKFDTLLKHRAISKKHIKISLASWAGYAKHGQTKFQLNHILNWSKTKLSPELQDLCLDAFFPTAKIRQSGPKQKQSNLKIVHSVWYQSPLLTTSDEFQKKL